MLLTSSPKYAHADKSNTYHLLASKMKTLCGLSVLPILLSNGSDVPLHLTQSVPVSHILCKHCTRVLKQLQHSRN